MLNVAALPAMLPLTITSSVTWISAPASSSSLAVVSSTKPDNPENLLDLFAGLQLPFLPLPSIHPGYVSPARHPSKFPNFSVLTSRYVHSATGFQFQQREVIDGQISINGSRARYLDRNVKCILSVKIQRGGGGW